MHATSRPVRPAFETIRTAIALGVALLAAAATPALAADRTWQCTGSVNFNVGNCWVNNLGPQPGDNAIFQPGTNVSNVTVMFPGAVNGTLNLNKITLNGGDSNAPVRLLVNGGSLQATTTVVGDSTNGWLALSNSTYPSATFTTGTLQLGLQGGSNGWLSVDGSTSTLNATVLQVGVNGYATANQTAGVVRTSTTQVGGSGSSYTLSGGTFTASAQVTNAGHFTINGGAFQANTVTNTGDFSMSGGTLGPASGSTGTSIDSAGDIELSGTANVNISTLTLRNRLYLSGASGSVASASVLQGGSFNANGSNTVQFGTLQNWGTVNALADIKSVSFSNAGSVVLRDANINASQGIYNGANASITGAGTLTNLTNNAGTVEATGALYLTSTNNLATYNSGTLRVTSGAIVNDTAIQNNSTGVITGKGYVVGRVYNQGQVIAAANADLVMQGTYWGSATSVQRAETGGRLFFYGPASFESGATIGGPYALFNTQLDVGGAGVAGRLTASGALWLFNANYVADIFGTAIGSSDSTGHDLLVMDTFVIDGSSKLTLNSGAVVLQAGQRFDLFDWNTLVGTFSSIDSSGLHLAAGTVLDLSQLYVDGSIGVSAVPEPAAWMLLVPGLMLVWRRRAQPDMALEVR